MRYKSFVGISFHAARLSSVTATLLLVFVLLAPRPLRADTYNWVGSSGDWSNPANWLNLSNPPGNLPTADDSAYITNGGTAAITLPAATCFDLYLLNATVQMTGGDLSTTNSQYVPDTGTGTFMQSGGSNTIAGNGALFLGNKIGSSGAYSLSAGQLTAPNEQLGIFGSGTFTQAGGTNSVGSSLTLGPNAGGSGMYNLSGSGQLIAPTETIGSGGTGAFVQSGGTNSVSDFLSLGNGTYNLSGSGQLTAPNQTIGFYGTGAFTQSGGTNTVDNALVLGYGEGSNGTYSLNGGLLIVASLVQGPAAAFNFSGGTLQASGAFSTSLPMTLGNSGGGATLDTAGYAVTLAGSLSGPGSLTKLGSGLLSLPVANTFSGPTLIGGGTLALGSSLALQNSTLDTTGSGALELGSLTSLTLGGLAGPGNLSLTNAASAAVALTVGGNGANTTFSGAIQGAGSLTKIGGGTLLLGGSNNYIGSTAINAGTLQVVNTVALPGYATPGKIGVASSAALAVSAGGSGWTAADIGALLASNSSGFASGSFLGIDTSGGSLAYDASIAGSIALKKLGSNALVLSGSNQYSGGTMVVGGSLVLTDPEAIADGSSLTVGAAAAFLGASVSPARPYADSPAAMAAVPEPGTLALAGVAGIVAGLFKAFYLFKSRRSAVSRAR